MTHPHPSRFPKEDVDGWEVERDSTRLSDPETAAELGLPGHQRVAATEKDARGRVLPTSTCAEEPPPMTTTTSAQA